MLCRRFSLLFLISSFLFVANSYSLTFEETALGILKGSPSYHGGELSLIAAEEAAKTQGNLPDPQLDGEYLFAPGDETDRWGAEFSWGLEWPGVYKARSNEANMRLKAAKENLAVERAQKLADVKSLLLDYILCTRKLDILQKLKQTNDSITLFSEVAANNGEITVLDLHKVKLEAANIRVNIAGVANDREDALTALSEIYGGDCLSLVRNMTCEFPALLIPSPEEIEESLKNSPAMEAAKTEAEVARLAKKVSLMEALPNLSIGYKHAYEEGVHFNGPTLGISIPVFSSHNKQKAAKAAQEEAEYKAEQTAKETRAAAMAIFNRLSALKNQIDEIEPLLSGNDHAILLMKAYENGLISMIDYLTECNYYTSASLELLGLKHAAALALTSLQKLTTDCHRD